MAGRIGYERRVKMTVRLSEAVTAVRSPRVAWVLLFPVLLAGCGMGGPLSLAEIRREYSGIVPPDGASVVRVDESAKRDIDNSPYQYVFYEMGSSAVPDALDEWAHSLSTAGYELSYADVGYAVWANDLLQVTVICGAATVVSCELDVLSAH